MSHPTTVVSQAEMLFKRKIRTKLPKLDSVTKAKTDEAVQDQDRAQRDHRKFYTDQKRNAKEVEVAAGNETFLQQKTKRQDKLTSFCEPEQNGSKVLVESPAGDRYKQRTAHTN